VAQQGNISIFADVFMKTVKTLIRSDIRSLSAEMLRNQGIEGHARHRRYNTTFDIPSDYNRRKMPVSSATKMERPATIMEFIWSAIRRKTARIGTLLRFRIRIPEQSLPVVLNDRGPCARVASSFDRGASSAHQRRLSCFRLRAAIANRLRVVARGVRHHAPAPAPPPESSTGSSSRHGLLKAPPRWKFSASNAPRRPSAHSTWRDRSNRRPPRHCAYADRRLPDLVGLHAEHDSSSTSAPPSSPTACRPHSAALARPQNAVIL